MVSGGVFHHYRRKVNKMMLRQNREAGCAKTKIQIKRTTEQNNRNRISAYSMSLACV